MITGTGGYAQSAGTYPPPALVRPADGFVFNYDSFLSWAGGWEYTAIMGVLPVRVRLTLAERDNLCNRYWVLNIVRNSASDSDNKMDYDVTSRLQPEENTVSSGFLNEWRGNTAPPVREELFYPTPDHVYTKTALVSILKDKMIQVVDAIVNVYRTNGDETQRADAIKPLLPRLEIMSEIIITKLTEMEIDINGRKRKIIQFDTDREANREDCF